MKWGISSNAVAADAVLPRRGADVRRVHGPLGRRRGGGAPAASGAAAVARGVRHVEHRAEDNADGLTTVHLPPVVWETPNLVFSSGKLKL